MLSQRGGEGGAIDEIKEPPSGGGFCDRRQVSRSSCQPLSDYRILRDAATALKHGELIYPKPHLPRLVGNVHQIQQAIPGAGVLMCGYDRLGETAIFIPIPSSNSSERPEFMVRNVLKIAEDELSAYGL